MGVGSVFISGASGFVGRAVVAALPPEVAVHGLSRRPQSAGRVTWSLGALGAPDTYRATLERCDAVIHAAALTGKAADAAFVETNVRGTEALVTAAERAQVRRFLCVSSIAVRFKAVSDYPYARSKRAAEAVVRSSTLDWTILRPTIVLGPRSPAGRQLRALADLPWSPLPGTGAARVQPVMDADVAEILVAALSDATTTRATLEVGGPEVLSIAELLGRLRERLGRTRDRLVRLPLGPILTALRWTSRLTSRLPGPGPLTGFREDSTAEDSAFVTALRPRFRGVEAMLMEVARG